MRHEYRLFFETGATGASKHVGTLLSEFGLQWKPGVPGTIVVDSDRAARRLLAAAERRGVKALLEIITRYERKDALAGELGFVELGPANTTHFKATLPKDAFDLTAACPRCGMGGRLAKPHILRKDSLRSKANFAYGHEGTFLVLMRSEIGKEIVEATGQPECMRHPVLRSGEVVKGWMEAVPTAILPPLSRKSTGVMRNGTLALRNIGDGPTLVPPCPSCKRTVWAESHEEPCRLVYSREAIESVRGHAVVLMHEVSNMFPKFDPRKREFSSLYGYPWPLFSRAAIEVLLKYMQTEHIRDSAWIRPVFSE